ncbi:alpha/beta fold hydrolase [Novosphingobium rosa]|uniref:alpha/beta fold hydrolase n=1 Tax=Novosphingobium rosa TaxID=76978 RepID=UPI00082B1D6C|nr:alpha/beta hydrolase [Novosphingobium rosa]
MAGFARYLEKGTGPAVIFNHGTLMDATMFAPQMDYLAAKGYRVIAQNSRALLEEVPAAHSLDDLAADTLRLADDLGLEHFVAAGMSVGAFSTINFALNYPDRCKAAIFIDTMAVDYPDAEKEAFRAKFDELNVDGPVSRAVAEWSAPFCFGKTTYANNMALVQHWIDRWATLIPARAVWAQSTSWTHKADYTPRLKEIACPVLMLHGEEDVPLPLERVLSMVMEIPDLTMHKFARVGHTANLEAPDLANRAIGNFLDRIHGR